MGTDSHPGFTSRETHREPTPPRPDRRGSAYDAHLAGSVLCSVIFVLLAVWLGRTGHLTLFHTFMPYDDEGYILLSLINFHSHGSLYDQVYSQYGPVFYLFYDTLHRLLRFEWTNTSGRWITLCNWIAAAVLCSLFTRRAGGSWPLTLFVLVGVFAFLGVMANEPMHPGATTTLIVAAAAWLGWEMLDAGRINAFAFSLAVLGTLLALVKINVGAFLLAAAVSWLVLSSFKAWGIRRELLLIAVGSLATLVLMRTRIEEQWARTFFLVSTCSIAGAVLAAGPTACLLPAANPAIRWFMGGGCLVASLTTCLMLPRGTTIPQLWEGVVVGPLRHPGAFAFGPEWIPISRWLAPVSLAVLVFARLVYHDRRMAVLLAMTKIAASAMWLFFTGTSFGGTASLWPGTVALNCAVPLAGLLAWPLDRRNVDRHPGDRARAWLALVLVFQALHAYPVAGSQLSFGTFLCVPLIALAVEDAVRVVSRSFPGPIPRALRIAAMLALALLAARLATAVTINSRVFQARHAYECIAQPGAERISLPAASSSSIRIVSENIRAHGDLLFSQPGSYSFNLWTGIDTPTRANATHWFSLLNDEQQRKIIRRLEAADRPILIRQPRVLESVMRTGVLPKGPLLDYLDSSFREAFTIGDHVFCVRDGRTVAATSTGVLTRLVGDGDARRVLRLTIAPPDGAIAAVELWSLVGARGRLLRLDGGSTTAEITPLHLDGTAAGPAVAASWPWSHDRLSRVTLTFRPGDPLPPPDTIEVLLITKEGRRAGTARLLSTETFPRDMLLETEELNSPAAR